MKQPRVFHPQQPWLSKGERKQHEARASIKVKKARARVNGQGSHTACRATGINPDQTEIRISNASGKAILPPGGHGTPRWLRQSSFAVVVAMSKPRLCTRREEMCIPCRSCALSPPSPPPVPGLYPPFRFPRSMLELNGLPHPDCPVLPSSADTAEPPR